LRLPHVLVLLAAELGNVGRVVVLLNRVPSDLDEAHLPKVGICQRRHDNPRHCEVLISKAIITPGLATRTDVAACGLAVRDEPERETSKPLHPRPRQP